MYYIVKLGNKTFYSKEIIKHVRKLGDAGIIREVAKGTLKQTQILSVNLYELKKEEAEALNVEAMGVEVQNLKEVVKGFSSAPEGLPLTSAKTCITWSQKELGDILFVELRSILYAKKYQVQEQLPILDVCGTRYVAVNTVKKGSDKFIAY